MLGNEDANVCLVAICLLLVQTAFTHFVKPSVLLLCEQGRCGFGTKVCMESLFHRGHSFLADPQQQQVWLLSIWALANY